MAKPTQVVAAVHNNCEFCAMHIDLIKEKLYNAFRPDTPTLGVCDIDSGNECDTLASGDYTKYKCLSIGELVSSLFRHVRDEDGCAFLVSICSNGVETIKRKATNMHSLSNSGCAIDGKSTHGVYGRLFFRRGAPDGTGDMALKIMKSDIKQLSHKGKKCEPEEEMDKDGNTVPGTLAHERVVFKHLLGFNHELATRTVCGGSLVLCKYEPDKDADDVHTITAGHIGVFEETRIDRTPRGFARALCMPAMGMPMSFLSKILSCYMRDESSSPELVNAAYGVRLACFKAAQKLLSNMHSMGWLHGDFKLDNMMTNDCVFRGENSKSHGLHLIRIVEFMKESQCNRSKEKGESEGIAEESATPCAVNEYFMNETKLIDLGLSQRLRSPPIRFDCDEIGNKYPGISDNYYGYVEDKVLSEMSQCKDETPESMTQTFKNMSQLAALDYTAPYMDWISLVSIGIELVNTGSRFGCMWDQLKNSYRKSNSFAWQDSWLLKVKQLLSQVRNDNDPRDTSVCRDELLEEIEKLAQETVDALNVRINLATDIFIKDATSKRGGKKGVLHIPGKRRRLM